MNDKMSKGQSRVKMTSNDFYSTTIILHICSILLSAVDHKTFTSSRYAYYAFYYAALIQYVEILLNEWAPVSTILEEVEEKCLNGTLYSHVVITTTHVMDYICVTRNLQIVLKGIFSDVKAK